MLPDDHAWTDHRPSANPRMIAYRDWPAERVRFVVPKARVDMMRVSAELYAGSHKHMLADANLRTIKHDASAVHEATVAKEEVSRGTSVERPGNAGLGVHPREGPPQNPVTMTA
ncbi:hypothetical protein [Cupriavidus taiwanensis]|uniref:hypothetical protein n=1 Tax=Cupriavidus taiwanensis TaxID=164546 RepID=UPI001E60BE88|nr:hypothetical protein [Cupriavidus taiwanensis]